MSCPKQCYTGVVSVNLVLPVCPVREQKMAARSPCKCRPPRRAQDPWQPGTQTNRYLPRSWAQVVPQRSASPKILNSGYLSTWSPMSCPTWSEDGAQEPPLWPLSALDAGCAGCFLLTGCWVYNWLPALLGDGKLWLRVFPIQRRKPEGSCRARLNLCRLPLLSWLLGVSRKFIFAEKFL